MAEIARFKLRRPIKGHQNAEITELVLSEPKGGLYLELGDPLRRIYESGADGRTRVEQIVNYGACRRYLAEMSGLGDVHLLEQMHWRDLDRAIAAIVLMFSSTVEDEPASSTSEAGIPS